ncbi:GAF domain-containing protein [Mailhella sp.]|uniref:GAF domain-containing protein n=1 Tax=Mailhella sp. TaxID=1981029 RepID=UPI003AB56DF3
MLAPLADSCYYEPIPFSPLNFVIAMLVKNPVESILALAASVFDAYSVVLFESPRNGQGAPIMAAYSQGDHINQNAVIQPGKGLAGWILRNRSPIVVGSIDENQAYLGYYKEDWEPEICSFLGCPLPDGGILCIDSCQRHAFSPEKQKLVAVFADMLSQVQSMESRAECGDLGGYLQALDRLVTLRQNYPGWKHYLGKIFPVLLEATGFTYAAFASRVEGSSTYIMEGEFPQLLLVDQTTNEFSIHNDIIGWVFRNGEAVYSDGFSGPTPVFGKREGAPSFGCTVCVPVTVNKSTCGVLCLAMEEPRSIPDELKTFLHLAADDLARLLEVLSLRYRLRVAEKVSVGKK